MGSGTDIYDDVTGAATDEFELEHKGKTTEFEVEPLSRPRKNGLVEVLPDGYLEPLLDPDEIDQDEIADMSGPELKEFLDEKGVSMSDVVRSRTLSEEATETALDCIEDTFNHDELSPTQVRNLFQSPQLSDEQFERALQTLIEVSSADEDVVEFREE